MEIFGQLPQELRFNVFSFLSHPTADMMRERIEKVRKLSGDPRMDWDDFDFAKEFFEIILEGKVKSLSREIS